MTLALRSKFPRKLEAVSEDEQLQTDLVSNMRRERKAVRYADGWAGLRTGPTVQMKPAIVAPVNYVNNAAM